MSDPMTSESPLVRFDLAARSREARGGAGIVARERAFLGHLNLRGNRGRSAFHGRRGEGIGRRSADRAEHGERGARQHRVLARPRRMAARDFRRTQGRARTRAAERRSPACARPSPTSAAARPSWSCVAARVRELLAKGCPLDLHPRVFDVGQCAQSHLAKAPILIRQLDREPAFEIVVRRSFADYLWVWLEDAAAEYGFEVDA